MGIIASLCLYVNVSRAGAEEGITAGGPLLRETAGPRAAAMGQAYVGLADDAFGLSFNPAGLSRLSETQLGLQHTSGLSGQRFGYLSAVSPLGPRHALGVSVATFDAGDIELFDEAGQQTQTRKAQSDRLIHGAYSFALRQGLLGLPGSLYLGAGARHFQSTMLEEAKASVTAWDVGALYQMPVTEGSAWSFGASAMNIGQGLRYSGGGASGGASDPLPRVYRLGTAFQVASRPNNLLTLSAEVDRFPEERQMVGAFGMEYQFFGFAALRAGYRYGEDLGNFTFGAGLRLQRVNVSYAVRLVSEINHVQQLAVNYGFKVPGIDYPAPSQPQPPKLRMKDPFEDVLVEIGRQIDDGEFFKARESVSRILVWFPDSDDGRRALEQIDNRVAAVLYRGPEYPRYHYALVYRHFFSDQWEEAVSACVPAIKEYNNAELKKYCRKALDELRQAQRIQKLARREQANELFSLAMRAFDKGEYEKALAVIDKIVKIADYPPAVYLRNRILNAKTAARRAPKPVELEPAAIPAENVRRSDQLYYQALREYAAGELGAARMTLRRAAELNPTNQELANTLLRLERELKKAP